MRLLHLADWHLGRVTYNQSRAADHDRVLAEIERLAREARPDLIVHAGDVWDAVRPSYLELSRGIDALRALAGIAPVVVLCGNHDSPYLFQLFDRLVGTEHRLRFVAAARPAAEGGVLELGGPGDQVIRLASVPFVHQNRMIDGFEDPKTWMTLYADRVEHVQRALDAAMRQGYDPGRHVLLFAAHLHVTGSLMFSGSERPLHITDGYATRLEHVPGVSYAAYGHIHRPQALPSGVAGRYAGSPIPLDFGEEGERKSVVVVDAEPGRPARVEVHPLSGGRPLRRVEGTLERIRALAPEIGEALCLVTVDTQTPAVALANQVRDLLPDAVLLNVTERCAARRVSVLGAADVAAGPEPGFAEVFRAFLMDQGTRAGSADRVVTMFEKLIARVQDEIDVEFGELDELELRHAPAGAGAAGRP
jgi:exonuclease SbcD